MKTLCFLLLSVLLFAFAISRPSPNGFSGHELISDGEDEKTDQEESRFSSSNPIRLNGMDSGEENIDKCEQMYGFLPCSETVGGHLFLILVYEYLLFHAESYVGSGGKRVFKILGPGVFGASAFQVIGSLPEALILLSSGLLNDKEVAQELVLTGVGLLAGSSILLLTLLWGTCVILGTPDFPNSLQNGPSSSSYFIKQNLLERSFSSVLFSGYGVATDLWTCYTARIMVVMSVIPFTVIQFPLLFNLSLFGERISIAATLVISLTFLIFYFVYQLLQPSIQRRRLMYIKHEHLIVDVLNRIKSQANRKLLTRNGSPNVSTIRRLFKEKDQDGDKVISFSELKDFLQEIKSRKLQAEKDNSTSAEIMKEFDIDNDEKINEDEFVNGMTKWLDEFVKSPKGLRQIVKPWIQKKREEREMMKRLIPDILKHLEDAVYGSLLKEDGTPDVPAIKRLFKDIDLDKDNYISYSELKELINNIMLEITPYDPDVAASKIMEELDVNRDERINEDEFVAGLSKWLNTTYTEYADSAENNYQKTWEQTDKLLEDKSPLAWTKAIALILLGLVMLGILAEPLIQSVRRFSTDVKVPSFYVAFVFVPLATNARIAVSAIQESRTKKLQITSLTMSEIYGTVIMNNVLGLAVLLSLVYFRELAWTFSSEVLIVLIVSSIVGGFASFSMVYPIWTSILAYFLYPLSLVLVYILGHFNA